jgi:hypothetical protein
MQFVDILKATAIVVIGFIILSVGVVVIPIMLGIGAIWIIALIFGMEDEEESSK